MAVKCGSLIFIKIGGVVFSGLTSNTLNFTVDTPECTTKDSNNHKEYYACEDGWTIDFEALHDPTGTYNLDEVFATAQAKSAVAVIMGGVVAGDQIASGSGIINSLTWGAPKNDNATVNGSIQGTGALTIGTVTDATAPVLESAWINNASPTVLRLKFSEDLDPAYVVAGTAWNADGSSSGAKTVSSTTISGDKIYLTMQEAYVAGDTVTVAYTAPGGAQDIRDKSGNLLVSFTAEAVTNNVA